MKTSKKKRLEEKGWKVGEVTEFLGLSREEEELIELKLTLSREVALRRKAVGMTQAQVATRIGSSQSRVAKMELGDPSVTVDLLLKTLLKLGSNRKEIGKKIAAA